MKKSTTKIELVETHNIALSVQRVANAPNYSTRRIHRTIFNGLQLSHQLSDGTLSQIRIVLGLP